MNKGVRAQPRLGSCQAATARRRETLFWRHMDRTPLRGYMAMPQTLSSLAVRLLGSDMGGSIMCHSGPALHLNQLKTLTHTWVGI
jgi:hypothetical protein